MTWRHSILAPPKKKKKNSAVLYFPSDLWEYLKFLTFTFPPEEK